MPLRQFSDEQARAIVNLEMAYQAWIETLQRMNNMPYNMRIKETNGHTYLYEVTDRAGNMKSLGALDDEKQIEFDEFKTEKADLKERVIKLKAAVQETSNIYRVLRLPLLQKEAGAILLEADRQRFLGNQAMVVGTNAIYAYALEANAFMEDAPLETKDFDIALTAIEQDDDRVTLWKILKEVDMTYTVNAERPFQARNSAAYEVEVLAAPSRVNSQIARDKPRPVALPEQEWLLNGRQIDRIVGVRGGMAARVYAPDPRWFALQKLWMSVKPERNPQKKPKDAKQGSAILDAVWLSMPLHPLDAAFFEELPDELKPHFEAWEKDKPKRDW